MQSKGQAINIKNTQKRPRDPEIHIFPLSRPLLMETLERRIVLRIWGLGLRVDVVCMVLRG